MRGRRAGRPDGLIGRATEPLRTTSTHVKRRGDEPAPEAPAEKVARINPNNALAHLIIGSVRQDKGQKEAAIEAYEAYLKLAPKGPYATDVERVLRGMK